MAGILKRIIWVWPKWDQENHQALYEQVRGGVGMATVRSGEALKRKCSVLASEIRAISRSAVTFHFLMKDF